MRISVSSQATLNNTDNNFVFGLYDASAPTVLLESQAPDKPYGNPIQITFNYNCLSGHVYIIKLWESEDTTASGVVRNSFSQSVNNNTSTITLKMDEYLEADVTDGLVSGEGSTSYENEDWAGWEYSIERVGIGTMIPNSSDNTNPNYSVKEAGGFDLIQTGDYFQPNEKFVVRFTPQVTTGPAEAGTPSATFAAGQTITEDTTLTSADSGQALLLQSDSNKLVITMPSLSSVADFTFFYFFSNGGSHVNAVIQAAGTDKFTYNGDRSNIILGQCETARVFKFNGKWNIENELTGMNKVGEIFFSYSNEVVNSLVFGGQLVNRDVYVRAWEFVSELTAIITDASWTGGFVSVDGQTIYANKGYFSTGNGSTTFRMPLLTDQMLKGADGVTRLIGTLELDQMLTHQHEETIGLLSNALFGRGGTVRVAGNYHGTSSTKTDLTNTPVNEDGEDIERLGDEVKVRNTATYLCMRI